MVNVSWKRLFKIGLSIALLCLVLTVGELVLAKTWFAPTRNRITNRTCAMESLRFYFTTWNVGTASADDIDFHDLLGINRDPGISEKSKHDCYFIGLQEVKSQPQDLISASLFEDPWTAELKSFLEKYDYVKIKTSRLLGTMLNMFCLRKHLTHIRDIEKSYTRTGFSGLWGNKGGVSVRFNIYGCSVCVVNAHLAAHEEHLQDRISDYNTIIREHEFKNQETSNILYHDYVFWLGDLNFRLMENNKISASDVVKLIEQKDYKRLIEKDQLNHVRYTGEAFSELLETTPEFPPTFKFEVGTSHYDLKRKPAWCDRVLYKVIPDNYENVTLKLSQKSYKSHPQYSISDHKPVTAEFVLKTEPRLTLETAPVAKRSIPDKPRFFQVFSDLTERNVEFDPINIWYLDEDNDAIVRLSSDVQTEANDWVAIYKDNFSNMDDYVSYVYVKKGSSPLPERRNPGESNIVDEDLRRRYTITFPESTVGNAGRYVLVYVSENDDNVQSILGISEPFEIRLRDEEEN